MYSIFTYYIIIVKKLLITNASNPDYNPGGTYMHV